MDTLTPLDARNSLLLDRSRLGTSDTSGPLSVANIGVRDIKTASSSRAKSPRPVRHGCACLRRSPSLRRGQPGCISCIDPIDAIRSGTRAARAFLGVLRLRAARICASRRSPISEDTATPTAEEAAIVQANHPRRAPMAGKAAMGKATKATATTGTEPTTAATASRKCTFRTLDNRCHPSVHLCQAGMFPFVHIFLEIYT